MRIKIINTGEMREVNASYGLRLIEQGKAKAVSKPAMANLPARKENAKTDDAQKAREAASGNAVHAQAAGGDA